VTSRLRLGLGFFLLDFFPTVLDDVLWFILLMEIGQGWKTDGVCRTRVRAGDAADLTVQRVRYDGAVSLVIEFEDLGAAAENT